MAIYRTPMHTNKHRNTNNSILPKTIHHTNRNTICNKRNNKNLAKMNKKTYQEIWIKHKKNIILITILTLYVISLIITKQWLGLISCLITILLTYTICEQKKDEVTENEHK